MAQKEYLKMADVFVDPSNVFVMGLCDEQIKPERNDDVIPFAYAAHAINSHDELVAEVERLREHLKLCATELQAMIDRHNVHNMEDDSWLYDHQTPWEAMQLVK